MDIAKKLKDIRKSKDISVYKLSQMSGVSETHIRDLERGGHLTMAGAQLYNIDKEEAVQKLYDAIDKYYNNLPQD